MIEREPVRGTKVRNSFAATVLSLGVGLGGGISEQSVSCAEMWRSRICVVAAGSETSASIREQIVFDEQLVKKDGDQESQKSIDFKKYFDYFVCMPIAAFYAGGFLGGIGLYCTEKWKERRNKK